MKHWMFNCKEVSRKVSESMDQSIPLSQRLMIQFHFMMCKYCARMQKQLMTIRHALRAEETPTTAEEATQSLSQDARERLKQLLHNAVKESG